MPFSMHSFTVRHHMCAKTRWIFFILLSLSICMVSVSFGAIKTWTGNGADGQWSNPLNWDASQLPSPADDVLLDNTMIGTNYTVTLPNTMVVIRALSIKPALNQTIQLILPASNMATPGFTVTGPGYGINLERGAIFSECIGPGEW